MSWEVDKTEVATTNEGIYGKQRERDEPSTDAEEIETGTD